MSLRPLTPIEARVLGTLMEKARTVPDSYPLTLNSVLSGCNQKTSREPLMQLDETQVQMALDNLKLLSLVFESSGARVARYEHNFNRALGVPDQAAALLGLLMLRGPQTAGELRINTERWHRFADISSVEAFLDELQERPAEKGGALVVKLPRLPGAREQRWAHLLCGPVSTEALMQPSSDDTTSTAHPQWQETITELQTRIEQLEHDMQQLRAQLAQLAPPVAAPHCH